jgi:hypothetical protein
MCHVVCLNGFFLVDEIHSFTKTLEFQPSTQGAKADALSHSLLASSDHPLGDWLRTVKSVLRKRSALGKKSALRLIGKASLRLFNRIFFRIEEMAGGNPHASDIWKTFKALCPISLERTQDYLHWRYDLHPDYHYMKYAVFWRWGGAPLSFWVARIQGDVAYLLEGFCRQPFGFLWSSGLDKLEILLARFGTNRIAAILPTGHPTTQILREKEYETFLEGRITARLGYGTPHEVTQNWYYTYGDHDDF